MTGFFSGRQHDCCASLSRRRGGRTCRIRILAGWKREGTRDRQLSRRSTFRGRPPRAAMHAILPPCRRWCGAPSIPRKSTGKEA